MWARIEPLLPPQKGRPVATSSAANRLVADTQVQVLSAINDHCEVHGTLLLDHEKD
jgi:hypothetical protein